jgi:hypothetical protein
MATPNEKLAAALEALRTLQTARSPAVRSGELSREAREILLRNGFLQNVMKGWYIPTRPGGGDGETTAWYAAFWGFCRDYLTERFGAHWSLTPEQSLLLHAGNFDVPRQLLVRARGARNQATSLIHDTSIFEGNHTLPEPDSMGEVEGMRVFKVEPALILASPNFFQLHPIEARTIVAMQSDAAALLERLLSGGHSHVAGRMAGAFRNIGRAREADEIIGAMRAAGFDVRESDPFAQQLQTLTHQRDPSPYVQRIRLMWQTMRQDIVGRFPEPPGGMNDIDAYMQRVDEIYVSDAYHSLSIEGYQVSAELIERVRSGAWRPDQSDVDLGHQNGLAARGYWQAFQSVKQGVRDILEGARPGAVAERDHNNWRRELFAPSVAAGILDARNLAGYRTSAVYIRGSRHTPLSPDAVRDAMPTFFDLLREEADPAVRIVLGHFVFLYIHPYGDGNGRTARFLMNLMMAAAGYPWTIIPVQQRAAYIAALERASVDQDIVPFAHFIADLIGQATPRTP